MNLAPETQRGKLFVASLLFLCGKTIVLHVALIAWAKFAKKSQKVTIQILVVESYIYRASRPDYICLTSLSLVLRTSW